MKFLFRGAQPAEFRRYPYIFTEKRLYMLKYSSIICLLIAITASAFAQNQDSTSFVKAKWAKTRVAPRTKLITFHFNGNSLFNANENITYVEVKNNGRRFGLEIAADEKKLITTSNFAEKAGATAAINGTFFDVKNGGSVDFVKVDGKVVNNTRLEKNNSRARHQRAALVINAGVLEIQKWDGSSNWEEKIPAQNVMLTGPLLLYNSVKEAIDSAAFNTLRHPRTCIGIKPDGKILLLTVDGRNENSAGVSMFELTKIMAWLGCSSAVNLDGGGSTTLWVNNKGTKGVVNYPTDNKKWDHNGERKVANVVILKKR